MSATGQMECLSPAAGDIHLVHIDCHPAQLERAHFSAISCECSTKTALQLNKNNLIKTIFEISEQQSGLPESFDWHYHYLIVN